jgi:ribosomal protein S18 acetylase RimI-like enzyme
MLMLKQIASSEDLGAICAQMQPELWGKDNEMTSYQPEHLKKFLETDQNLLMVAYDNDTIAGVALCYELPHPAGDHSLYVHELDTHPDYRRQGVATQLMKELFKIAKKRGLREVWVGTETSNKIADKFYRSLNPHEVEPSYIYSYKNTTK